MSFRLRPEAESDIDGIISYIAVDSPSAALRWFEEIHQHCKKLGATPGMGVARFDVREGLRMFPAGNHLILYAEGEAGVEMVRVLHSARQWQKLL